MRVASVVGARPQFIKAAVVSVAMAEAGLDEVMVHTGQHYDKDMSDIFFEQLGLPEPKYNLEVGSESHGAQTGRILERFERVLLDENVDMVVVYGDTNSTIAGALAAAKLHIPIAHVEAGLRSFNRRMPEEINRVLTDYMSDLLFVPTAAAVENLRREGIPEDKVHVTGDVMYDAVLRFRPLYETLGDSVMQRAGVTSRNYFVVTLHRAENTDDESRLRAILDAFQQLAAEGTPVVWPVHPRTRHKLSALGINAEGVRLLDPLGYFEMQALLAGARGALTDSGGLQKEAAFHGIPTVTLRDETEWPETIEAGCNVLAGADTARIVAAARAAKGTVRPPSGFGKGDAAAIIARTLRDWRSNR